MKQFEVTLSVETAEGR